MLRPTAKLSKTGALAVYKHTQRCPTNTDCNVSGKKKKKKIKRF